MFIVIKQYPTIEKFVIMLQFTFRSLLAQCPDVEDCVEITGLRIGGLGRGPEFRCQFFLEKAMLHVLVPNLSSFPRSDLINSYVPVILFL